MKSIVITGFMFLASITWAGIYSGGGSGTADNPYRISTPADWQVLMTTPQDWDKHFKLTGSLDLAGLTLTPVGNSTTKFSGVFRGDGWTIRNAVISQPGVDNVGLFGYLWGGAKVQDVRVENAFVEGRYWVGGLVGRTDTVTLEAVSYQGTVKGISIVGGLVGSTGGAYNMIRGCYTTGTVVGSRYLGGLVGFLWGGRLNYCYSQASVSSTLETEGPYEVVGGLVGRIHHEPGAVSIISKCYAAGLVTVASPDAHYIGGLVGQNESATVTDSFWDIEASSQTLSDGGIGKPTAQMKQAITYINAGWDFVNLWELGEYQTYPYIRTRPSADLNRDGIVGLEDFSILAEQWLTEDIQVPPVPGA
jgi:hypothetical protein